METKNICVALDAHHVPVWMVNTGWTGGPYGVGQRMNIQQTRDMVRAALGGALIASNQAMEYV